MNISDKNGTSALHWDGTSLHGEGKGKSVVVTISLRLLALRREILPAAPLPTLRAALRIKAERDFAVLGPVVIDAILYPPKYHSCTALVFALPVPVQTAIKNAVQAQGHILKAIEIAELQIPVLMGGVISVQGESTLIAHNDGEILAFSSLGRSDAPEFDRLLQRERVRLNVPANTPAVAQVGQNCNFLQPSLTLIEPWLHRRSFRVAILAATLGFCLVFLLFLHIWDLLRQRQSLLVEAANVRPVANELANQRADMKELAAWFGQRPLVAPTLALLAKALPPLGSDDQVRLVRLRQIPGEDFLAEGIAADRGQMMDFLKKLRQDPHCSMAEIRSFRAPTKGSNELVFELVFRMKDVGTGGSHAGA